MAQNVKKTVKGWAVFCETCYKPMKEDFGVIYSTEKEAKKGLGKCDYIVPCEVTYFVPKKKNHE